MGEGSGRKQDCRQGHVLYHAGSLLSGQWQSALLGSQCWVEDNLGGQRRSLGGDFSLRS